jgi:hypothetical protein
MSYRKKQREKVPAKTRRSSRINLWMNYNQHVDVARSDNNRVHYGEEYGSIQKSPIDKPIDKRLALSEAVARTKTGFACVKRELCAVSFVLFASIARLVSARLEG